MEMNYKDLFESVSKVDLENEGPKKVSRSRRRFYKKTIESKAPDGTDTAEAATKKLLEEEESSEETPLDEGKMDEEEEELGSEDPRVKNALLVIMGRAEGVKEEQVKAVLKAMADAQDDELMMAAVNSFRMQGEEPTIEHEPEVEGPEEEELESPEEEEYEDEMEEAKDPDVEEGCHGMKK